MTIKNLLGATFVLASLAPASAQVRSTAARPAVRVAPAPAQLSEATVQARADALTTNMAQGLSLTPAQTEKVRVINANSVRNVEAARLRYRQDPAKLKGYVDDVGLSRLEQLKDVLTPNQFARYQQTREQKMGIPAVGSNQGNPTPGLNTSGREGE